MMSDDAARAALEGALAARGFGVFSVADTAHAMGALGRSRFEILVAELGQHPLAVKGLCLLARKRHPAMRLFVLHHTRQPAGDLPDVGELLLDAAQAPSQVAQALFQAVQRKALEEFHIPTTTQVWETLEAAAEEARIPADTPATKVSPAPLPVEVTRPPVTAPVARSPNASLAPPSWTVPAATPPPVLDNAAPAFTPRFQMVGDFAEQSGAALLMTCLAQRWTGALHVDSGPAQGSLFFLQGDPVWSEDVMGDAGLLVQLIQLGRVPPSTRRPAVPERQLLPSLVQAGALTAQAAQQAGLLVLRRHVTAVAACRAGAYRLVEERDFLDVVPLLRVNAFALMLEAQRTVMGPGRVAELVQEQRRRSITAGPSLDAVAERIAPFVTGERLDQLLEHSMPVEVFWRKLHLDEAQGARLVHALANARLVTLQRTGPASPTSMLRLAPVQARAANAFMALPDTEIEHVDASRQDSAAREEEDILALYLRLKPLTQPHEILGVAPGVTLEAAASAYRALAPRLDVSRVPQGPHHALLTAHLVELRHKVDAAFSALTRIPTGHRKSPW